MCNHDCRHTRRGPRKIVEDRLFCRAVKCAGRLVEHEQSGALQDRPRDCYPLLLASGEFKPTLADNGLQPIW